MSDDAVERANQRTISAAGAPPAAGAGAVSSPFEMGRRFLDERRAAGGPDSEEQEQPHEEQAQAAGAPGYMLPRARKTLKACGPLTLAQLAEGLGADQKQTATMVARGVRRKVLRWTTDGEGRDVVDLVPAAGLKTFLAPKTTKPAAKGKGVSSRKNGGGSVAAKKPARAKPSPAAVKRSRFAPATKAGELTAREQRNLGVVLAPTTTATPPRGSGGFRCGLYSDGSLEIHTNTDSINLTRDQVRELVAYLDKLASALSE